MAVFEYFIGATTNFPLKKGVDIKFTKEVLFDLHKKYNFGNKPIRIGFVDNPNEVYKSDCVDGKPIYEELVLENVNYAEYYRANQGDVGVPSIFQQLCLSLLPIITKRCNVDFAGEFNLPNYMFSRYTALEDWGDGSVINAICDPSLKKSWLMVFDNYNEYKEEIKKVRNQAEMASQDSKTKNFFDRYNNGKFEIPELTEEEFNQKVAEQAEDKAKFLEKIGSSNLRYLRDFKSYRMFVFALFNDELAFFQQYGSNVWWNKDNIFNGFADTNDRYPSDDQLTRLSEYLSTIPDGEKQLADSVEAKGFNPAQVIGYYADKVGRSYVGNVKCNNITGYAEDILLKSDDLEGFYHIWCDRNTILRINAVDRPFEIERTEVRNITDLRDSIDLTVAYKGFYAIAFVDISDLNGDDLVRKKYEIVNSAYWDLPEEKRSIENYLKLYENFAMRAFGSSADRRVDQNSSGNYSVQDVLELEDDFEGFVDRIITVRVFIDKRLVKKQIYTCNCYKVSESGGSSDLSFDSLIENLGHVNQEKPKEEGKTPTSPEEQSKDKTPEEGGQDTPQPSPEHGDQEENQTPQEGEDQSPSDTEKPDDKKDPEETEPSEPSFELQVPTESFQTLADAKKLSNNFMHVEFIETADDKNLANALRESYLRISRMRFKKSVFKQAHLNFHSLKNLTEEKLEKLPEGFLLALKSAQILEANSLLAPTDSIEERRRKGVILETINEVKMMFSNVTPVKSQISERAMFMLAPYLDRSARIGRA